MPLVKTLIKHGTSKAIIIDRPVLELLNITDDTPLAVETDGRRLIITPQRDDPFKARLADASEAIHRKYHQAFEALAEGPP